MEQCSTTADAVGMRRRHVVDERHVRHLPETFVVHNHIKSLGPIRLRINADHAS